MRLPIRIPLLCLLSPSHAQVMTLIAKFDNGMQDTVRLGFVQNATQGEDIALGEQNIFMTLPSGYEGRILQRDSNNYSCADPLNEDKVYYPDNFDSKLNYRDISDTSLQNRLFEVWYTDNIPDSIEMSCDIPLHSFLGYGIVHPFDCALNYPEAILIIEDDTIKQGTLILPNFEGFKQLILITEPNILLLSTNENENPGKDTDIVLYPNPTSGKITVQNTGAETIQKIFIFNSIGTLIEHFDAMPSNAEINLEQYSHGVYVAIIELKTGMRHSQKIVKQ